MEEDHESCTSTTSAHPDSMSDNLPSTSAPQVVETPHSTTEDDVFFGRTTRLMWKAQTEAASSSSASHSAHVEPKWNEPDTEYTPPVKKSKKHRDESNRESSVAAAASSSSGRKKKKEEKEKEKTPKAPKQSKRSSYSVEPSSTSSTLAQSHHRPSQPRATVPPPTVSKSQPEEFKKEEPAESDQELVNHSQLDAKTIKALNTLREAASSSTPSRAAAIQDAINSVLSQPEHSTVQPAAAPQPPPIHFGTLPPAPAPIQVPVAVYPPAPVNPAPPPPPPPNVIPPSSELATEQRHTFMIPPTDPLYDMIVSYYFGFKTFCNQAKNGDPDLVLQLRNDIENEKIKKNELKESIESTSGQINELLASGVCVLKDRLEDLGMHGVADVSELLAGSKQIVTQHKTLTNNVAQLQSAVNAEEHRLTSIAGPDALKYYEEAIMQNNVDVQRLAEILIASRPPNFVAQILPDDINCTAPEMKVSPSSRKPRQQRPRQGSSAGAGGGGRRGGSSSGRRSDGASEDVELEIQQFVQHALKVDNAVKEKERKARGTTSSAFPTSCRHFNHGDSDIKQ